MIRAAVHNALGTAPDTRIGRVASAILIALIILNIVALVVETIPEVHTLSPVAFSAIEVVSVAIFTVEYLLRVWSCTTDPRFSHPITGRLRFMVSPMALVDLAAILPFYAALLNPATLDLRVLRAVRLVARVARWGERVSGLRTLGQVVRAKSNELLCVVGVLLVLLLVVSSLVFFAENGTQPEAYSSIPETMWWGIITLTTVGYGDAYPVTIAGRLLTGLMAILGIGLFALPAGILGSGFMQAVERRSQPTTICSHCGMPTET